MKTLIIVFAMALFAGCEKGDDRLIYRQSIPSDLSTAERLKIEKELKANGWDDIEFIYDFRNDVVIARKAKAKEAEK